MTDAGKAKPWPKKDLRRKKVSQTCPKCGAYYNPEKVRHACPKRS